MRPKAYGRCPSARRKDNQRDRGSPGSSPGCARTTRADSPCGLHTPFSAKASVASADATLANYEAISEACCHARNALIANAEVITSIGTRQWAQVKI